MSWFEDLFINEAKPALNGRPSSGGSSEGGNSSGGNSGPCSWNDLKDKPFGDLTPEPIVFDGNLDGKVTFSHPLEEAYQQQISENTVYIYVKISDRVFTTEELNRAKIIVTIIENGVASEAEAPDGSFTEYETCIIGLNGSLIFFKSTEKEEISGSILQAPETGLYTTFQYMPDYNGDEVSAYCRSVEFPSQEKDLDEKFIPETIARTSEVVPAPATASVGQTVVVKAVDENGKPTEWEAADMPYGEGGAAIIDVVELPTENIREDAFYRLLTGSLVLNRFVQNSYTVYCVETLPESGEPASNIDQTAGNIYYSVTDNETYGYVDAMLSAGLSIPVGWYPGAMILQAAGYSFAGIITNILDDSEDDKFRLLLEFVVYDHKDGKWTSHKSIGWAGKGPASEIFNHPSNEALGTASHAEGSSTTASGDSSHAEGSSTTASGYFSHAEGSNTTASGSTSHAEGTGTTASGSHSHAEGSGTTASGSHSHAEGLCTTASGQDQHVQGRYNIADADDKYAHIVGNGWYDHPTATASYSNAHTLDWDGNAWFAGGIELTSPNGTRYRFTVSDDGTLSAAVVTE